QTIELEEVRDLGCLLARRRRAEIGDGLAQELARGVAALLPQHVAQELEGLASLVGERRRRLLSWLSSGRRRGMLALFLRVDRARGRAGRQREAGAGEGAEPQHEGSPPEGILSSAPIPRATAQGIDGVSHVRGGTQWEL